MFYIVLLSMALCQIVLGGSLPEHPDHQECTNSKHNTEVLDACLKGLDDYETVDALKAAKTACQLHEEIEDCVKEKGGLCKSQAKEFYGLSGIFEVACENKAEEETLWKFLSEVLSLNAEAEHQLEHDFSACLEESALNFFDFAKVLFHDAEHQTENRHNDEDDFELDPSKLLESIYVCGVSSLAKALHLDLVSLDKLAKGFLAHSDIETADKFEVCKSKLTLPTELCANADVCHKDDDHNDLVSLKCLDEVDGDVSDYSVYKGKDKSLELYNKLKTCVDTHGGFCHDQSLLGPALLHVFKHVSEHEEDGNVWWELLNKFEHVSDEDENKFENTFVHCLNESNSHFLNPHHLSVQSFEELENYVEALYVCVVASLADTFHANYHSVGRLSNAFVGQLGFEVDDVKFCGHPLSLPTTLCAAA